MPPKAPSEQGVSKAHFYLLGYLSTSLALSRKRKDGKEGGKERGKEAGRK